MSKFFYLKMFFPRKPNILSARFLYLFLWGVSDPCLVLSTNAVLAKVQKIKISTTKIRKLIKAFQLRQNGWTPLKYGFTRCMPDIVKSNWWVIKIRAIMNHWNHYCHIIWIEFKSRTWYANQTFQQPKHYLRKCKKQKRF